MVTYIPFADVTVPVREVEDETLHISGPRLPAVTQYQPVLVVHQEIVTCKRLNVAVTKLRVTLALRIHSDFRVPDCACRVYVGVPLIALTLGITHV